MQSDTDIHGLQLASGMYNALARGVFQYAVLYTSHDVCTLSIFPKVAQTFLKFVGRFLF